MKEETEKKIFPLLVLLLIGVIVILRNEIDEHCIILLIQREQTKLALDIKIHEMLTCAEARVVFAFLEIV